MRGGAHRDGDRLAGARAEDEDGNVERKHEQAREHAASAKAERECGAHGSHEGEDRRAEEEARDHHKGHVERQVEEDAENRGEDRHRNARDEPVREDLGYDHHGKRLGGDEHLLERAVGMIGLEHARQREKRGEKRGDPHDAGGDRAEDVGFGAHAERHERHDDRKEEDHLQGRTCGGRRASGRGGG